MISKYIMIDKTIAMTSSVVLNLVALKVRLILPLLRFSLIYQWVFWHLNTLSDTIMHLFIKAHLYFTTAGFFYQTVGISVADPDSFEKKRPKVNITSTILQKPFSFFSVSVIIPLKFPCNIATFSHTKAVKPSATVIVLVRAGGVNYDFCCVSALHKAKANHHSH